MKRKRVQLGTILAEALSAIAANKSRTILTLMGIIIGIASVITVLAAGAGGKSIIMKEFEGLSPTSLYVSVNWQDYSMNTSFKQEAMDQRDVDSLQTYAPSVTAIAPLAEMRSVIRVGNTEKQLSVTGTTDAYIEYVEFSMNSGRIITEDEVRHQDKVAVIGYSIKEEFFQDSDPLGKYLTINGAPVKVIGVLDKKEKGDKISISNPDDTYNNTIIVPITMFKRIFGGDGKYWTILAKAVSIDDIPKARMEILAALAKNHGKWDGRIDKYSVTSMKEQLEMINKVVKTVTIGVAILAGIALLVAAIGIMNIMLVSVKERTREIGIRKALGAKQIHIQLQFLLETLLLCGGGGLMGLGVASLAALIIGHFAKWPVIIDPATAVAAVVLSIATGILSGFYPAVRAARLIPHEALRYE